MGNRLLMALISLIPSLGICVFIYFKDKKEKEPLWLLGLIFVLSGAVYIPVYYLGNSLINLAFTKAFSSGYSVVLTKGLVWSSASAEFFHHALCALVGVALPEEIARWLVLYCLTGRSRHFNCTFDGVVYSVVSSMGAALAGNLRVAFTVGWDRFLLSFLKSFPWYMFFGIVMGIFYTMWFTKKKANDVENRLIREGKLKKNILRYPLGSLILSFAVPTVVHALYSLGFEQYDSRITDYGTVFYVAAAAVFVFGIVAVFIISKRDRTHRAAVEELIEKEHGDLPDEYYSSEEQTVSKTENGGEGGHE